MSGLVLLLDIYGYIIIARAVMSFMDLSPYNPIVRIVYTLTEPVLGTVRRVLPPFGGFDFSPLVVLVAIWLLHGFLSMV